MCAYHDGRAGNDTRTSEDDMMMFLINQSVNRIWDDYDTSKDGFLTLAESSEFIRDSFGNVASRTFTEQDI